MARWLVSRNDTHFEVNGLADLKEMAKSGRLGPGDMVQPPGTTEWLYAIEIPELKPMLQTIAAVEGEDDDSPRPPSKVGQIVFALGLIAIIGAGGFKAYEFWQARPQAAERKVDNLAVTDMVVTGKEAQLVAEPDAGAAVVGPAAEGTVYELIAKRGGYYRAKDKAAGTEGWIRIDQVMPMYMLGGGKVMQERDPIYNPDRYVNVGNASWDLVPQKGKKEQNVTIFQFMLVNESMYDMTDLVVLTKIKDAKGHELEQKEIKVEGVVPANGNTMVGTLVDPKTKETRIITQASFSQMAASTPDLALEYSDGVEVHMEAADFTEATMDVVELRAITPDNKG